VLLPEILATARFFAMACITAMLGQTCVLLSLPVAKRKQSSDIEQALGYLKDCKRGTKKI
jgi:hypothetical protein